MRRLLIGVATLTVIALALLSGGCGKHRSTRPQPHDDLFVYPAQSSAENCLISLNIAYTQRNLDELRKLFSTDFAFVPCAEDVIGPDHLPSQWGLANELEIHTHMFDPHFERPVDSIVLSFQQEPMVSSEDEYPNTWKVAVYDVQLRVVTFLPNGVQWDYVVDDGRASFYFKEYPGELAIDGRPLWRIVLWKDGPYGPLAAVKAVMIS